VVEGPAVQVERVGGGQFFGVGEKVDGDHGSYELRITNHEVARGRRW
jgi:hypothetical protein